jgi:hypothetical protein
MIPILNKVCSNCIFRNAFANCCCSKDNDSIASRNCFAFGIVSINNGMIISSVFSRIKACFGSKVVAEDSLPNKTINEEK